MPDPVIQNRLNQRLAFAQACCLCLGFALVLWSLAPAVVDRIITHRTPPLSMLTLGSASLVLGLSYIVMHRPVRRGARWALWVAFSAALVLATTSVVATFLADSPTPTLFPLILAGATVVTTWLALRELGAAGLQPPK